MGITELEEAYKNALYGMESPELIQGRCELCGTPFVLTKLEYQGCGHMLEKFQVGK
jgi:hypothetical protein